jgi:hypothetical protein
MFIRPQPYTCLGIAWLTQGGVVYYFSCFIRPKPYTCLGIAWLTQGGVVYYFSCLSGPNPYVYDHSECRVRFGSDESMDERDDCRDETPRAHAARGLSSGAEAQDGRDANCI